MLRRLHPQFEVAPAVYQIPEDLPANVAWRLASMYRLRPGDAIVFQPFDELPFSGVTHYQPERAPDLEGIIPLLDHVSGPAYHCAKPRRTEKQRAPRQERRRLRVEG